MKHKKLFLIGLMLLPFIVLKAQISFEESVISSSTYGGACSVYAIDLDGDEDMDVLSASYGENKIAWYQNDGSGNFGSEQIISDNAECAYSVYATDIDGDGDMDVLSASACDDKIAWYQNNGSGDFGSEQIISDDADGANSVYAADIDGDGDMDVLSASSNDNKITWYKNDGYASFPYTEQTLNTSADHACSVYATDLDGDGDIDVLSASKYESRIAWYKNNNGLGAFIPEISISNLANYASSVYAADIDGDGNMDVLSASEADNKIAWYQNDGSASFSNPHVISTNASCASSVYATDLDNDGDVDVLSASYNDNKIAWYQNDGAGNFGAEQIISTNANYAYSVYAADIDGDGNMDVLSASMDDGKIAWYKQVITSINEDNIESNIFIHPNPTKGLVNILGQDIKQITIIDITGKVIRNSQQLTETNNKYCIDLSNQAKGIYFINVLTKQGATTQKIIIE